MTDFYVILNLFFFSWQRHVTIQKDKKCPQLERCTKCCKNFHCPFCMASIFKPSRPDKVKLHLKSHCNKAVVHGGINIFFTHAILYIIKNILCVA